MARDLSAYLQDVLESCKSIQDIMSGISLEEYRNKRAVRSAVEREFIIIGQALRRVGALEENLMSSYVPDRGDLVWLEFTPQAGSEQRERRPALVLSPKTYNGKVGLALFCPITSKIKGYPFEVLLPDGYSVSGVVLSDQLKSLDWRTRKAKFIERMSSDVMAMVTARVLPRLEPDAPATL